MREAINASQHREINLDKLENVDRWHHVWGNLCEQVVVIIDTLLCDAIDSEAKSVKFKKSIEKLIQIRNELIVLSEELNIVLSEKKDRLARNKILVASAYFSVIKLIHRMEDILAPLLVNEKGIFFTIYRSPVVLDCRPSGFLETICIPEILMDENFCLKNEVVISPCRFAEKGRVEDQNMKFEPVEKTPKEKQLIIDRLCKRCDETCDKMKSKWGV